MADLRVCVTGEHPVVRLCLDTGSGRCSDRIQHFLVLLVGPSLLLRHSFLCTRNPEPHHLRQVVSWLNLEFEGETERPHIYWQGNPRILI
jgi:hypothetical protein